VDQLQHILPHWEDLPELDLYMDQVLHLTQLYLTPLGIKPLTAAMINNYVKNNLLPAPVKKRYSRVHVAYIFAIALLKDSFEIATIKKGVDIGVQLLGAKVAYNLFCTECENALRKCEEQLMSKQPIYLIEGSIDENNALLKMAALTFATKRILDRLIVKNLTKGENEDE